jgi:DNA-binding response OmpR family regulator
MKGPTALQVSVSALMVGEFGQDRLLMHDVFRGLGWRLFEAPDRRRAVQCLGRNPVQVVLAGDDIPNWNWKKILHDLRALPTPPQLIVVSRTADDYLWAEVLNCGAYDVLPRPLERDEVERVISAARRHFNVEPARATRPAAAAAGAA